MEDNYVQVFIEGTCERIGQANTKAGIGVWFGENSSLNISKPVRGHATSNNAEIQAATEAIKQASSAGIKNLCINVDSEFLMDGATKWMPNWKENGWTLSGGGPIQDQEGFKNLDKLISDSGLHVKWNRVPGYSGVEGNKRADELAKSGAQQYGSNYRDNSRITYNRYY